MEKMRVFTLDGDALSVCFRYDAAFDVYLGSYPDFLGEPRYTPNGRPWKSVVEEGCPYADPKYRDCGTCPHLKKEDPGDLIGVCFHEAYRLTPNKTEGGD